MNEQVLEANDAFYAAIRAGDMEEMEQLWARQRTVTCTHPDCRMLIGRDEVMKSWRMILQDSGDLEIWPSDVSIVARDAMALLLCTEIVGRVSLIATNTFVRERAAWKLINHQAAHLHSETLH